MICSDLLNLMDGDGLVILRVSGSKRFLFFVSVRPSVMAFDFIDCVELPPQDPALVDDLNREVVAKREIMLAVLNLENAHNKRAKSIVMSVDDCCVNNSQYKVLIEKGAEAKITARDVRNAFLSAIERHVKSSPLDYIFDVCPVQYVVDDRLKNANPVGIEGRSLRADMAVMSMPKIDFSSFTRGFEECGIGMADFIPSILGTVAVKATKDKNLMIVQVGEKETMCACCFQDAPVAIFSVAGGLSGADEALSMKYKISQQDARAIALSHADVSIGLDGGRGGSGLASGLASAYGGVDGMDDDYILHGSGISRKELSAVVRQNLRVALIRVREELERRKVAVKIDLVLATGVGSLIKGIEGLFLDEFRLRSEVDDMSVNLFAGIVDADFARNAYVCNGVVEYLLKKHRRLSGIFRKSFWSFLPSKLACFLDEIF